MKLNGKWLTILLVRFFASFVNGNTHLSLRISVKLREKGEGIWETCLAMQSIGATVFTLCPDASSELECTES